MYILVNEQIYLGLKLALGREYRNRCNVVNILYCLIQKIIFFDIVVDAKRSYD
jgi:hypothetical protein